MTEDGRVNLWLFYQSFLDTGRPWARPLRLVDRIFAIQRFSRQQGTGALVENGRERAADDDWTGARVCRACRAAPITWGFLNAKPGHARLWRERNPCPHRATGYQYSGFFAVHRCRRVREWAAALVYKRLMQPLALALLERLAVVSWRARQRCTRRHGVGTLKTPLAQ